MSNLIPAVAYYRMSTDRQDLSIPQQQVEVKAFAKVNGYAILREYRDEGISGDATEKRAGFLAMREDATRLGDFEVILVDNQARFGRFDMLDAGYWIKPLRDAGVRLVCKHEGVMDWNNFAGRVTYAVQQEGKKQFLLDQSYNSTRGRIANARAAYFNGGRVPYGFDRLLMDDKGAVQTRLRRGESAVKPQGWKVVLTPTEDHEQLETVRLIFKTYADGGTLMDVANALNERRVPAPGSGAGRVFLWSGHTVREILKNEHYVGDYRWGVHAEGAYHRAGGDGKGNHCPQKVSGKPGKTCNRDGLVFHQGAHDGVIDRDLWDRAQRRLAGRQKRQWFRTGGYVLTGLLRCGHCGGLMQGSSCSSTKPSGKQYHYRKYVCATRRSKGKHACGYFAMREDVVLPYLLDLLEKEYLAPEKLRRLESDLLAQVQAKYQTAPGRGDALEGRLKKLDAEIRQAARNYLRATDNLDLLGEELDALRKKRDALAAEARSVEEAKAVPVEAVRAEVTAAVARLKGLAKRLRGQKPEELRETLRELLSRVEVFYETDTKCGRKWYRFVKGVVKLRPQVEVADCIRFASRSRAHSRTPGTRTGR